MRRIAAVVLVLCFMVCGRAYAAPGLPYYLALGDSLGLGIQPRPDGTLFASSQGYVDGVYSFYRLTHPLLQVAKLGCSGETTTSMIIGGKCWYALHNQLDQAIEFLHTHRVLLITITIGGDDVLGCIKRDGTFMDSCPGQGLIAVGHNLPYILSELRAAAGPHVPIVATNYYDPFLAASVLLPGSQGQDLAQFSLAATISLNALIENLCSNAGDRVADVARAFKITDFANVPGFNVPLNVFLELTWTWIGAPPPRGPDVHPNAAGYAVIATAFIRSIGPI
jgi:lysophospholipase L1-like esterase